MNIKRINELDYINNPEGFYGICSDGNGNTKRYKISVSEEGGGGNSPIEKGDAEHSAVLKGEYEGYSNKAISQTSMAVGAGTTAGLKGWYYGAINKISDNTINVYLSSKQVTPKWSVTNIDNPSNVNLLSLLGKNTVISLINDSKYDNKFVIKNGREGMVQLSTVDGNKLPFNNIVIEENLDLEDYSIYCLTQPTLGEQNLAIASFAEGYLTESTNGSSHAEGYLTKAHGKFSHAEGRETVALYASHAEGQDTKALGTRSHAEGFDSIANGNGSHVEGQHNVTNGQASHAEGYYTETNNVAEHASGQYNVSTQSDDASQATHFSIGIGTSGTDRKNAFEVKQDGTIYIRWRDNFVSLQSVLDVLNNAGLMSETSIVNIIDEINSDENDS